MGSRMALNILKSQQAENKKHKLYVYDKFPGSEGYTQLVNSGAFPVTSVSPETLSDCDVFISMVPSSSHVEELYRSGLLPLLAKRDRPAFLIECSTIDPAVSRRLSAEVTALGHVMVDAPVSGGIKGAEAGTLTFMVGSSLTESEFANSLIHTVLQSMGTPIFCGAPGQGLAIKICNNLILGAQMLGVAEGYRLANSLGVDLSLFNKIVNKSTGQCWSSEKYNPVPGLMDNVPAAREYTNGFMTDLMIKDLALAQSASTVPLPVADFAVSEYKKVSASGKGHLDFGVCYKMY